MLSQDPPVGAHVAAATQVRDDGPTNTNICGRGVVVQLLMPLFLGLSA